MYIINIMHDLSRSLAYLYVVLFLWLYKIYRMLYLYVIYMLSYICYCMLYIYISVKYIYIQNIIQRLIKVWTKYKFTIWGRSRIVTFTGRIDFIYFVLFSMPEEFLFYFILYIIIGIIWYYIFKHYYLGIKYLYIYLYVY